MRRKHMPASREFSQRERDKLVAAPGDAGVESGCKLVTHSLRIRLCNLCPEFSCMINARERFVRASSAGASATSRSETTTREHPRQVNSRVQNRRRLAKRELLPHAELRRAEVTVAASQETPHPSRAPKPRCSRILDRGGDEKKSTKRDNLRAELGQAIAEPDCRRISWP